MKLSETGLMQPVLCKNVGATYSGERDFLSGLLVGLFIGMLTGVVIGIVIWGLAKNFV